MTEGINIGNLSEMINDKMDRDLMNALVKTDFVVESKAPDENDPTWYRVYKSGWLEQGGAFPAPGDSGSNPYTLNYPKAFNDTSYYINMAYTNNTTHCAYYDINIRSKTVQSSIITTHCSGTWYGATIVWEAKGFCSDNSMEGDDGETVFGNTYKTYFYSGVLPDYANGIDIPVSTTESTYTCTSHGRIDYFLGYDTATDGAYVKVNNKTMMSTTVAAGYPRLLCGTIDVKSGDVIKYKASTTSTTSKMTFYPYSEPAQSTNPTVTQIIDAIYPVGSIYIGTTVNCPIASIVGTWVKIDGDLVLQSSSSSHQAGTTIEAGLPNITGAVWSGDWEVGTNFDANGAFDKVIGTVHAPNIGSDRTEVKQINFNASRSNPIYGNSDTVQPPAYVVNIWKRTA